MTKSEKTARPKIKPSAGAAGASPEMGATQAIPWSEREMGQTMGSLAVVPTIARMSDGSLLRGKLSSERSFALLWSSDGEALARSWLKDASAKAMFRDLDGEVGCALHAVDFLTKSSLAISLNVGFLECAETKLLDSEAREAWVAAYDSGARYVDGLGFARCRAPKDWRYELKNPREARETCAALCLLMEDDALDSGDVFAWVKALQKHARAQKGVKASQSLLSKSAEGYFVALERSALAAVAKLSVDAPPARKVRL